MLSSNREKKRWRDAKVSSNPHLIDRTRLQKLSFQNLEGMAEASSAWGLLAAGLCLPAMGLKSSHSLSTLALSERRFEGIIPWLLFFWLPFFIQQSSAKPKVGIKCPTCLHALENVALHFLSSVPHFLPAWTTVLKYLLFSFFYTNTTPFPHFILFDGFKALGTVMRASHPGNSSVLMKEASPGSKEMLFLWQQGSSNTIQAGRLQRVGQIPKRSKLVELCNFSRPAVINIGQGIWPSIYKTEYKCRCWIVLSLPQQHSS